MWQVLFLLRAYNYLGKFIDTSVKNISYVYSTLDQAFRVKTHILFDGISAPYDKALVNVIASSAKPLWFYQGDSQTFIEWSRQFESIDDAKQLPAKTLPILSMAVVDADEVLHDLTDFLDTVTVHHSEGKFPSIAHILAAWTLSSGIVLDTQRPYFANMITSTANTIAVPIDTHEYLNTLLEEPVAQST